MNKKKPIGIVLYKGPSNIDGKMIVAIATGVFNKSENEKTGNMIQTWILRADCPPIIAKQLGHDFSICGDCKHKHFNTCYVDISKSPNVVFNAYIRDRYIPFEESHLELFKGRTIRLGAYGDPAAVPTDIWEKVCNAADGHTGYSHQWNTHFIDPKLKKYVMASCDNETEYYKARKLGWRSFRIRINADQQLFDNEFVCPASNEFGNKTSCSKCKACMGLGAKTKKDPVIIVHGLAHWISKFAWGMQRIAWKEKYRRDFEYPIRKKKKSPKRRKKASSPDTKKSNLIVV